MPLQPPRMDQDWRPVLEPMFSNGLHQQVNSPVLPPQPPPSKLKKAVPLSLPTQPSSTLIKEVLLLRLPTLNPSSRLTTPTALPHAVSTRPSPVTVGPSSTPNLKAPHLPPMVYLECFRLADFLRQVTLAWEPPHLTSPPLPSTGAGD